MYLQDYKTYLDLELYSDVGSNADSKEHGCCFNLEPFIAAFGGYRDTACHHRKKISAVLFNVFINCLNEEIKYTEFSNTKLRGTVDTLKGRDFYGEM